MKKRVQKISDANNQNADKSTSSNLMKKKCFRKGKITDFVPSTSLAKDSIAECSPSTSQQSLNEATSISETIEEVIQNMTEDYNSDEDPNINSHVSIINDIRWGPVTGENLKQFEFIEQNYGFCNELYESHYNKTPYDFYKLFINSEILNLMVNNKFMYKHPKLIYVIFFIIGY